MTSASPRLERPRKTYVRLIGKLFHVLNQALSEEKAERGLNKTEIAKILGVGRSAISKKFDGRQNLTFETLAALADAMDRDVDIALPKKVRANAGSNSPSPEALSSFAKHFAVRENSYEGSGNHNGPLGSAPASLASQGGPPAPGVGPSFHREIPFHDISQRPRQSRHRSILGI